VPVFCSISVLLLVLDTISNGSDSFDFIAIRASLWLEECRINPVAEARASQRAYVLQFFATNATFGAKNFQS
jgi:hypothetical protein